MPAATFFPVVIAAGLLIGLVGFPIERVLRTVYRRDESYQLLITFGLLLMFQDVFRFTWGATPRTMDNAYMVYGVADIFGVRVPTYNLLVIAASIGIAIALGLFSVLLHWARRPGRPPHESPSAARERPVLRLLERLADRVAGLGPAARFWGRGIPRLRCRLRLRSGKRSLQHIALPTALQQMFAHYRFIVPGGQAVSYVCDQCFVCHNAYASV